MLVKGGALKAHCERERKKKMENLYTYYEVVVSSLIFPFFHLSITISLKFVYFVFIACQSRNVMLVVFTVFSLDV